MNYYIKIKTKLIENENYSRIKDYSKERYKVQTYFEVGRILSEAGKHYGENIIGQYASQLVDEIGKKYNERTLRRIRQFYNLFNEMKWSPVATKLSWSHYVELISIKDKNKILFYLKLCEQINLTRNQLREKIKNNEYERLSETTKQKLINQEEPTIEDLIKNPIIILNQNKKIQITEKDLQNIIIENITYFLSELGQGFCYIRNEYKIKVGDRYNYIDLLLYNIKHKCYVVIELKITELKKEHIGQIEVYMNYIDNNLKTIEEDKTIGIIICKKDNQFIMEYCSDKRILSREYVIKN